MADVRTAIDPTAKTSAYRFFTKLPDNRLGFGILHSLSYLQRWSRPKGIDLQIVTLPNAPLRVLVLRPKHSAGPLPMVLHLHGGGFAIGSPWQDLDLMARYIDARPAIFVAPAYRLALKAPYPAALEDAHTTLVWMNGQAKALQGRDDQIFVMGESAGGGLTAALSLLARDRRSVAVAAQFANYAMLTPTTKDDATCDPDALSWSVEKNSLAWDWYLRGVSDPPPYYADPTHAPSLKGLPPTYGFVGDHDLFLKQNVRFFDQLAEDGVTSDLRVFKGAYHGTELLAPDSDSGRAIWTHALETYASVLEQHTGRQQS